MRLQWLKSYWEDESIALINNIKLLLFNSKKMRKQFKKQNENRRNKKLISS